MIGSTSILVAASQWQEQTGQRPTHFVVQPMLFGPLAQAFRAAPEVGSFRCFDLTVVPSPEPLLPGVLGYFTRRCDQ